MQSVDRRHFMQTAALTGAAIVSFNSPARGTSPNEQINIGIVGCGTRGKEHLLTFGKLSGVRIAGICDPDRARLAAFADLAPGVEQWADMRKMFQSPNIDAVVIATCNHWHALAALWAMEAGKHVYIEKPLALTHAEGQQLVAATRVTKRIVQVGTQQRSDPMQAELKHFLHVDRALGRTKWVLVNRFGPRGPIGMRETPLMPPKSLDYNLWLGPAEDLPIYRNSLHYDWHWVWNTGSGEMGNWGVHVLDDVRNVVFQDRVTLPAKLAGAGTRVAWHDAGNTPNLQFVAMKAEQIPILVSLCNLATQQESKPLHFAGPATGYVVYCEGGRLEGERGRARAFDLTGKLIKEFAGTVGEIAHRQNFIDAIRANDSKLLNTPIEMGHASTAWCNLSNIASMLAAAEDPAPAERLVEEFSLPEAADIWSQMSRIVNEYGTDPADFRLGPCLGYDATSEQFTGELAPQANRKLRRENRPGFSFPN